MLNHKPVITLLIASFALWPLAGCDSLPGDKKTQGTVILEDNHCLCANVLGGCPRRDFTYWREVWLQRSNASEGESAGLPESANAVGELSERTKE